MLKVKLITSAYEDEEFTGFFANAREVLDFIADNEKDDISVEILSIKTVTPQEVWNDPDLTEADAAEAILATICPTAYHKCKKYDEVITMVREIAKYW